METVKVLTQSDRDESSMIDVDMQQKASACNAGRHKSKGTGFTPSQAIPEIEKYM